MLFLVKVEEWKIITLGEVIYTKLCKIYKPKGIGQNIRILEYIKII